MATDILIVDDEPDIRELISDILKDEGYATRIASNSNEALHAMAERVPSVMILDIWLQGSELDGLGILEIVQKRYPHVPTIMISGHGNIETAVASIKMGAYDFIEKPFKEDQLLMVVARAVENARLKRENQELRLRAGHDSQLIGFSPLIQQVRNAIDRVAPTNSRVMITGAPGTGKEVTARMIHHRSHRIKGPFVVLNAASMVGDRVEQELFGIEDTNPAGGAASLGVFERAHGGTLFIDEVADMPLELQGRILRVLQENAFERVGGRRRVQVDVRVIAASNRDLQAEMEQGRFREDLYYRLNVVPVRLPSLKERREDIPALCQHFLKRASESSGLLMREITNEAMIILQSYSWPGNVRQLRNVMEWILIMAPGDSHQPVRANMLPSELFDANPAHIRNDINGELISMPLRQAREMFERQYLAAQINRFGGNISKTSAFVGMERSALHRKLKMLGLTDEEKVA
jgi:two-component system nitrogen regulation response regulator NtrX